MSDLISRQAAIDEIDEWIKAFRENGHKESAADARLIQDGIIQLPSAQPEPLSHAYAKYVLTWLIDYQIKTVELQGRYSPYEVLSWVANDWRKENE